MWLLVVGCWLLEAEPGHIVSVCRWQGIKASERTRGLGQRLPCPAGRQAFLWEIRAKNTGHVSK